MSNIPDKSEFESIKLFIEAEYDEELERKFQQERREREELDMLKRVRKIIERNLPVCVSD